MSVQPRKLRNGKTVYWITFEWQGRTKWERAGGDKRAAESLESQRKEEVKRGTYNDEVRGRVTNERWFSYFFGKRNIRTLDNEISLIDNHVLSIEWFSKMPMQNTRPAHILKVVEAIEDKKKPDGSRQLGAKSVSTVYGIMKQAYGLAVFEEKIESSPCSLPRGRIKYKTAAANKRKPYPRADAHKLIYDPRIPLDSRVWNALALFTGMREGEVCGRRFRDWIREARPLSALNVHDQYNGQPLKTDDDEDVHPRMVPVHPELESILKEWWASGFEFVFRRPPTLDDFIVPNRDGGNHTKSSAYKMFRRSQARCDVQNRTLHSTRHTFISVARSNEPGMKDVLERVTHNASGEQVDAIDGYTTFLWRSLCKAVLGFDLNLDPEADESVFLAPAPGLEAGGTSGNQGKSSVTGRSRQRAQRSGKAGEDPLDGAVFDANQRKLLKLCEVSPEEARPGLAIYRGLEAARRGDLEAVEAELTVAADALGLTASSAVATLISTPSGERVKQ
jgi:integrase